MTLFDALWAFCQDHEYCGELAGGVERDRVWMTCTCGRRSAGTWRTDSRWRLLVPVAVLVRVAAFS